MRPVDIQIKGCRDLVNQMVEVTVKGEDGQQVAAVTTVLDGLSIGDENLYPPQTSYERSWSQVGTGAPNQTHVVVVTVVDDKGVRSSASKTWVD
jgi:hypothetical protein